ncbi:unnamed protein product [Closterium sp. NIES-54]
MGDRAGQTCGKPQTQHRCFSRLDDAWRAEFGEEAERPGVRVRSGSTPLLVSHLVAPDSPVAPPPWSPLLATPSWHALPPPCLWSSQVSASPPALACPTLPSLRGGVAANRSSLLLVSPDDCSAVDPPHGRVGLSPRQWTGPRALLSAVRLQLRERFRQDLPVLRRHSDMIHAAAPHFLWPFAVRYAAHQLNLWPRVSFPETSPTLRWTGEVGDAMVLRVWRSRAFVRDTSADKLSARAILCVFLCFPPDAPGWQFYDPTSRNVFPSQDVTFDESFPFYRLFRYRSDPPPPPPLCLAPGAPPVDPLPPQGPAPSSVSQVDPLPGTVPVEPGGAEPGGAESEGAGSGAPVVRRLQSPPGGAESGGDEPWGTASFGAAGDGDSAAGVGGAGVTAGACGTGGAAAAGPGGARTWGTGAAGSGSVGGAGAGDPTEPGAAGAGGAGAGGTGAGGAGAGGAGVVGAGAGGTGTGGARAGGAGAVDPGAGGARDGGAVSGGTGAGGIVRPQPQPPHCLLLLLTLSTPAALQSVVSLRRVCRPRPPLVPGTHVMALRPSSVPLRVPMSPPPESSLPAIPDPESDLARAASPIISRLLATAVIDPSFESTVASAPVAELVDFAAAYRLDYATALVAESESASPPSVQGECALGTDVLEDRQEDLECLAAAIPRFASMLLALEGDPDAPDIPTPRSYAEAITSPYSS